MYSATVHTQCICSLSHNYLLNDNKQTQEQNDLSCRPGSLPIRPL